MSAFKASKPTALFCYICSREFGSSSLQIHLKDCGRDFLRAQEVLPPKYRLKVPNPPNVPIPKSLRDENAVRAWNEAAWRIAQDNRNGCPWCGRKFGPDQLASHLNTCPKKQDEPGQYKQASRPRMLVCYICGREFGTMSLPIHQKQCIIDFQREQEKLPKSQRRPLPKPETSPFTMGKGGGMGGKMSRKEMDEYNDAAFQSYKDNLTPCPNCGRKFAPDRLPIHLRSCKPGHVLTPLKARGGTTGGGPGTSPTGAGGFGGSSGGPGGADIPDSEPSSDLVPCSKCERKFAPDRVAKHESVCKGSAAPKRTAPAAAPSQPPARKATAPAARSPAARSSAGGAGGAGSAPPPDSGGFDDEPIPTAKASGGGGGFGFGGGAGGGGMGGVPEFEEPSDLVECPKCGRKFASDRVAKHQKVCKGPTTMKTHTTDLPPPTKPAASAAKGGAKPQWQKDHEAFIQAMRAAKKVAQYEKEGRLNELPPPTYDAHDDYKECPYCHRRFAPQSYDRHVPKCATVINRPKAPPKRPTPSAAPARGAPARSAGAPARSGVGARTTAAPKSSGYGVGAKTTTSRLGVGRR